MVGAAAVEKVTVLLAEWVTRMVVGAGVALR